MELKNRVAVITGGTKGLGKSLALMLKRKGASVMICSRNKKELRDLSQEGILAACADVTSEKDLVKISKVVLNKFGKIDLWINNAGIWLPHAPIEQTDWKRAHGLMEVNLFGTVYGSKTALIQMRKRNSGMIVNILSTSALEGRPGSSSYSASKFAANGFTKALREEVKGTGMKVISVFPGGMRTNFFDEKKPDNYSEYMDPEFVAGKIVENIEKDIPEEELVIKRPTQASK
jgi:short-subunit dehydrogenase